ncbi:hypothetical protein E4U42_000305 [Claviceps africana]|uniref:Uncharacterized protein n=1 Tax=Claviceps africana TaxID=83212 RepID=A0A8K0NER0_9HYPO|nr:hypothetical protein E4U42_000305 [Claviceps africana]
MDLWPEPFPIHHLNPTVRLKSAKKWKSWFHALKHAAYCYEIWERVDPALPEQDSDVLTRPPPLDLDELFAFVKEYSAKGFTMGDAIAFRGHRRKDDLYTYRELSNREDAMRAWIHESVDMYALTAAYDAVRSETGGGTVTLRRLVKHLKKRFSIWDT